jgi:hypothetical protein
MRILFRTAMLMTTIVLLAGMIAPLAMAEVTTNVKVPANMSVFVPCANGGAGEIVALTGELHVLVTYTINKNTVSGKYHAQPQGISGAGLSTGDTYQATGVTQDQFSAQLNGGQYEETYVNNFRIIGQGPDNNYLVHYTLHITINQNGDITADVENISVGCK